MSNSVHNILDIFNYNENETISGLSHAANFEDHKLTVFEHLGKSYKCAP